MESFDVIMIGAGPAGLTAALYLQRAGYSTLTLEEYVYGGQVANTPEVENYPAVGTISGAELSANLYKQATEQGARLEFDGVIKAELTAVSKRILTQSGQEYAARAVIVANGARRRHLNIPGEETLNGRGVSYCATCDGGFFRGKEVAVIGGGNTALEDALYLANIAAQVHLIHRRDCFRGAKILSDAVDKRDNILIHYDTVPEEILSGESGDKVGAVRLRNVKTQESHTLAVEGIFVAVGLSPDNALFRGQLTLDAAGYLVAGEDTKTILPGVFAAGDTRTKTLRQIVTAASDGAVSAHEAGNYLAQL